MLWLCMLCAVLALVIVVLIVRVALLHKAADEIRKELGARLDNDTNTLITLFSDDRHMRRLAADLNAQLRLLRRERRRLQSGDRELKETVTNISHDLRTPLAAICGYMELLDREETSDTVRQYLRILSNRIDTLKQLTEELFTYSVVTSVDHYASREPILLNQALEESIAAYYAALKGKHITPQINITEQKIWRHLNADALSRIFGNVLNNAIKYSGGDLKITLSDGGELVFSNRAPQLDEIKVGRLFDRFFTVEDGSGSTGLGLSIAKSLTEQMNGTISAELRNGILAIRLVF
ncbi:MAG: HAMP domain-containing sensor histidine kinase [Oscillospiraceae bacterium]|nr:HAMP domain-containing sensor histidine kinase [Oscillospiraceae bacterium]